jgi:hypothetical protein
MDISNIIESMAYAVQPTYLNNNIPSNSEQTIAQTIAEIYDNCINNNTNINNNSNEVYTDSDTDTDTDSDTDIDNDDIKTTIYKDRLVYCIEDEQFIEDLDNEYHQEKNTGNWAYAKLIISQSYDNKSNTEWFSDYLEELFEKNNDCFSNIVSVYYKYESNCNADIDYVYEFETAVAKYLIDNLKIQPFKPHGYIFNNDENANKWPFKLTVITTKNIYSANRWVNENHIGFY